MSKKETSIKATKLSELGVSHGGVRAATKAGFATVYVLAGLVGLWAYKAGCKKDTVPESGDIVGETGTGMFAMFTPDLGATQAICEALNGVENPHGSLKRRRKQVPEGMATAEEKPAKAKAESEKELVSA